MPRNECLTTESQGWMNQGPSPRSSQSYTVLDPIFQALGSTLHIDCGCFQICVLVTVLRKEHGENFSYLCPSSPSLSFPCEAQTMHNRVLFIMSQSFNPLQRYILHSCLCAGVGVGMGGGKAWPVIWAIHQNLGVKAQLGQKSDGKA